MSDEVCEAKEIERPWSITPMPDTSSEPEIQQLRFRRFDLQIEFGKSIVERISEATGVRLVFKEGDKVVTITNKVGLPRAVSCKTTLKPYVQHVVEINITQHWRDQTPLGGALFTCRDNTILHHAPL